MCYEVNKILKRAHFIIPAVEEILPDLGDAKIFSVLDVIWHLQLDEASSTPTFLVADVITDDIWVYGRGQEAALAEHYQNFERLLQRVQNPSTNIHVMTAWLPNRPQQQAFQDIKTTLSLAPVLWYYDPVVLLADASQNELGAALL
ncbi:hypothetical protein PR048_030357 [Dryococelus australis]|uniref:Reverse transcriptase/retrotransposon-derived protein RNase H-like domain-containing protein n=1 Tax=Dryococelus australis TaxID=614101 RepID=A0ABQ9GCN1_9NEOP|nr:hypothetical protein PR048_030357 [Dryococelus australis]